MIKNIRSLFLGGLVLVAINGCTFQAWNQGLYEGFQETQRQKCYNNLRKRPMDQCLDKVNSMTYDEYMKKREDSAQQTE